MKRITATAWAISAVFFISFAPAGSAVSRDLPDIQKDGVIRHIGVPYANFVTGSGDGLDVELVKLFAQRLGVRYEYVKSSWGSVIGDLTGKKVKPKGDDIQISGETDVKGDMIANGFTILPWRQKIVDYSTPVFPTQVWIIAKADSKVRPIVPSGEIKKDISMVKGQLDSLSVPGVANTCLDPSLYDITKTGGVPKLFSKSLNELAPAVINGEAATSLLDVPDALIALEKWPGEIKVLGPVSEPQEMGAGFDKGAPLLREAFNKFLAELKADGTFLRLVKKYYPAVFEYYPEFFK